MSACSGMTSMCENDVCSLRIRRLPRDTVDLDLLKELAGEGGLNRTVLALNLSRYAKKHGEVSQNMFEGYAIHAITNGIHSYTWTADAFKALYDRYIPGWAYEPELFVRVNNIPDDEVWSTHQTCKQALVDYCAESAGVSLDPEVLTIGFARRATTYKRADLIFSDLERLREIGKGKLQIIYAGKAHPADTMGKELIQRVVSALESLEGDIQGVYLPGYDISLSSVLIPGVDVWLNNPVRPQKASGLAALKSCSDSLRNDQNHNGRLRECSRPFLILPAGSVWTLAAEADGAPGPGGSGFSQLSADGSAARTARPRFPLCR